MDTFTPAGRQIILDLLAKSIEKFKALDDQNWDVNRVTETGNQKKRKHSDVDKKSKKNKKKVRKDTDESFDVDDDLFVETDRYKCKVKSEIKQEYKEIETAETEKKFEP